MDEESVLQSSVDGHVTIRWSEEPQTLPELLEENNLPIIIRVVAEEKLKSSEETEGDIHAPLVIFREMKGTKVFAKNVTSIDVLEGAPVKADSPTVVIPHTYQGWFRLIDELESPLKTVANVAMLMPIRVLSTKFVSGYVKIETSDVGNSSRESTEMNYDKVEVQPGVLRVKDIFENYIKYTGKRKSSKRKLVRCLRCIMDDETEVLLPFDAQGTFFLIETRKTTSKHMNVDKIGFVYSIKDLLAAGLSKNVLIKLIHGRPPTKACGFTSVFQVSAASNDHTVIGCTMTSKKSLLELPVAKFPMFVKAENITEMYLDKDFVDTVEHLEKGSEDYRNEIKVRFNYSMDPTTDEKQ